MEFITYYFFEILAGLAAIAVFYRLVSRGFRSRTGNLQRSNSGFGYQQYIARRSTLAYRDIDKIVVSLKKQFIHNGIEAIIGVDQGGAIIGQFLSHELNIQCYPIYINTGRGPTGNAKELEDPNHTSYIGNLGKTHFAILTDFDPSEKNVVRVENRLKASNEYHTYQKAFVAVTRQQLQRAGSRTPTARSGRKKTVIWAVRSRANTLHVPW